MYTNVRLMCLCVLMCWWQGEKVLVSGDIDFNADGKVAKKLFEKAAKVVAGGAFFLASSDADGER